MGKKFGEISTHDCFLGADHSSKEGNLSPALIRQKCSKNAEMSHYTKLIYINSVYSAKHRIPRYFDLSA